MEEAIKAQAVATGPGGSFTTPAGESFDVVTLSDGCTVAMQTRPDSHRRRMVPVAGTGCPGVGSR